MSKDNNIYAQKQEEIYPVIRTIMYGYSKNPQKTIDAVRNEVIACAENNDFLKASMIFELLYCEYDNVDMKNFHFVPENYAVSDNSIYNVLAINHSAADDPKRSSIGDFISRLSSFFDDHPQYLATPKIEHEVGPEDISKPAMTTLLGSDLDNNAE